MPSKFPWLKFKGMKIESKKRQQKSTLCFQKRDTTGKKRRDWKMVLILMIEPQVLGLNIRGKDILLSALKNSEII